MHLLKVTGNLLLINEVRFNRNIVSDAMCPMFETGVESLIHLFCDCPSISSI